MVSVNLHVTSSRAEAKGRRQADPLKIRPEAEANTNPHPQKAEVRVVFNLELRLACLVGAWLGAL